MAPRETPENERMLDISKLYGDPQYSDLSIKYSGREMKVHKLVVCMRCKYFERALSESGTFKVMSNLTQRNPPCRWLNLDRRAEQESSS